MSQMHSIASAKMAFGSTTSKQNQRQEGNGRIIRRILSNKELRQIQSSRSHSEQQILISILEKEKKGTSFLTCAIDDKGFDNGVSCSGQTWMRITIGGWCGNKDLMQSCRSYYYMVDAA